VVLVVDPSGGHPAVIFVFLATLKRKTPPDVAPAGFV
jgi:hypothetical protein